MRSLSAPAGARDMMPRRVLDRPRIADWDPDEPMTLPEAASVFWPDGPLTTKSLRTAVRDGQLAIAVVAGKQFTCPRAVKEMLVYAPRPQRSPPRKDSFEGGGLASPDASRRYVMRSEDEVLADYHRLKATVARSGSGSRSGRKRSPATHSDG